MRPEGKTRIGYGADAAPVRTEIRELFIDAGPGALIAGGADEGGVGIAQLRPAFEDLHQHVMQGGENGGGRKTRDAGRHGVAADDEPPFIRPHDGGDMAGREQPLKAGRLGVQQHRHGRPGAPQREQE